MDLCLPCCCFINKVGILAYLDNEASNPSRRIRKMISLSNVGSQCVLRGLCVSGALWLDAHASHGSAMA